MIGGTLALSVAEPRSSRSMPRAPKRAQPLRGCGAAAAGLVEAFTGTDGPTASCLWHSARRPAMEPPFTRHSPGAPVIAWIEARYS